MSRHNAPPAGAPVRRPSNPSQPTILNAIPADIALLNPEGVVLSVNDAWRRHGHNSRLSWHNCGVGQNYLAICDAAEGDESPQAHQSGDGIRAVLSGSTPEFALEYPSYSPSEQEWFRLVAAPLATVYGRGALVLHLSITDRLPTGGSLRERKIPPHHNQPVPATTPDTPPGGQTEERPARPASRLAAVLEAQQRLALADLGVEELMDRIAEVAQHLIGADGAAFELLEGDTTVYRAGSGIAAGKTGLRLRLDASLSGEAIRLSRTLRCVDTEQDPRVDAAACREMGARSMMATLVPAATGTLGVLKVLSGHPGRFDEADAKSLELLAESLGALIQLRRTVEQLRKSEADYRLLFTGHPIPMWVSTLDTGRFLAVNQAAVRHYGFTEAEFLGMTTSDLGSADQHRLKHGELIQVQTALQPIRFGGHPAGLTQASDITEQERTEEARRASEERYRTLFEYAGDGILIADPKGNYLDANASICRMLGYPREELIGMPSAAIVAQVEVPHIAPTLRAITNQAEHQGEWEFRRKDGSAFVADVIATRMPDGNVLGMVRDITERRRVEAALNEARDRFRQLAENIDEVFRLTDLATDLVLYVSPAYERIWGRSREALYATPHAWLEAVHPEDRERVRLATTTHRSGSYTEEYRIVRADGAVRWVRDRTFPVRDSRGEVFRVAGLTEDITGRKQITDQLREQASLLDKAQDAIHVRDVNNRITYWNKSAERLYGWTAEEAVGTLLPELLHEDAAAFAAASSHLMRTGEWFGALQLTGRNGSALAVEARWTLVRDAAGEPHSILAINTDVTERNALEQQFLRAQRLESIGTLAGGIAHDLNNVLSPITMAVDLLRATVTDTRDRQLLDTMADSVQRGAEMVRQVLSFARGMDGRRVEVQPRHLIEDLGKIIRDTFPKGIQVRTALSPDLWTLQGDPTQLHQVLLNLCLNARDAMPEGGLITISAENTSLDAQYVAMNIEARNGPYVVIQIEDTGTGIRDEFIDKLFDPFFTTKEVGKGTGLGLSTSLGIVKSHGGFIRVSSELGKGTRFRVYLPVETGPSPILADEEPEELPRGHGEMVLIVDDEASIRQITRQTLEAFGYRVLLAADGAEAVALYRRQGAAVEAILMDMMMPVMNGVSAIRELRLQNPAVRIVAVSGVAASDSVASAAGLGVTHFLSKPYTADALLKVLRNVLAASAP